ncbi:DNA-binding transcriptional regulator, MarR family [Amycolatopsis xylanica]|uniref:DNA-binding transcriptional regulator, MarR family n=1 Tax=Amycolatopsis xylanica TaxID=589385 RepID=A0A1H3AF45_9PSEU|nr:bifunctional helix-turn-helix transcriptional regulator/GNAT family N-acetyltransferase [Amycolatopsis xylanica]SDX28332.1 DNA-binding transcriptional regulator, MarR family [Amycolatopsis xylanica]
MNDQQLAERVATVRAFNRLYTGVIGVLNEGPADAEYSLSEARVLFELAQRPTTRVPDLRKRLDLDAGYASRLLARLEARGLLTRERCDEDARRQVVKLTADGQAAFRLLNERTVEQIGGLLSRFSEFDQRKLLTAMGTISGLVGERPANPALVLRQPRSGDLGWVIERHGAVYAREYGWNEGFEALVARIAADYVDGKGTARQAGWIAELDGERVGSVFCMPGPDVKTARLRLLLVEPHARGFGLGKRLVDECVAFARASGYSAMTLWTVDLLATARHLYQRAGFRLDTQERVHEFGHDLVGQTWRLEW